MSAGQLFLPIIAPINDGLFTLLGPHIVCKNLWFMVTFFFSSYMQYTWRSRDSRRTGYEVRK
jgi:hypothetical protein